jgi:hypothetical protein
LTFDWARSEASEEKFERHIAEASVKDLVQLQWEMIDRFRELRGSRTVKGTQLPTYPPEFYVLWYRINTVMRQIVNKRDSREGAETVPEVKRDIERLQQAIEEVAQV